MSTRFEPYSSNPLSLFFEDEESESLGFETEIFEDEGEGEEEDETRRRSRVAPRRPVRQRRPAMLDSRYGMGKLFRPRRPPIKRRRRPRVRPIPTTTGVGIGALFPPQPMPPDQPQGAPSGTGTSASGPSPTPSPSDQTGREGGEFVRWVQSSLNSILGLNLPVDGVMDVQTRSAVRSFQTKNGLPADGIVGPPTQKALADASASAGATQPSKNGEPPPPGGLADSGEPPSAEPPSAAAPDGGEPPDSAEPAQGEYGLREYFSGYEQEFEGGEKSNGKGSSRIIDLTKKANKSQRKGMRDPKQVYALVLHQMACCFKVKDPLTRFLKHFAPHFAILPDGRILQLHPVRYLTYASNGFNKFSVAVEFAGNFPNIKGKWWFDRKSNPTPAQIKANQNHVTPAQIEAGRFLVRHLIDTMGLRMIVAHRQSSKDRENDPGPDVWYHVGQWAIDKFGLSNGGPGYKVGTGNPIPDVWRKWGEAKPKKEFAW